MALIPPLATWTFGDTWEAGVTVPANTTVVSDPIPFDLLAGQDVFLTFWAPTGQPPMYRDGGTESTSWLIRDSDTTSTIDWQDLSISTSWPITYIAESLDVVVDAPQPDTTPPSSPATLQATQVSTSPDCFDVGPLDG